MARVRVRPMSDRGIVEQVRAASAGVTRRSGLDTRHPGLGTSTVRRPRTPEEVTHALGIDVVVDLSPISCLVAEDRGSDSCGQQPVISSGDWPRTDTRSDISPAPDKPVQRPAQKCVRTFSTRDVGHSSMPSGLFDEAATAAESRVYCPELKSTGNATIEFTDKSAAVVRRKANAAISHRACRHVDVRGPRDGVPAVGTWPTDGDHLWCKCVTQLDCFFRGIAADVDTGEAEVDRAAARRACRRLRMLLVRCAI